LVQEEKQLQGVALVRDDEELGGLSGSRTIGLRDSAAGIKPLSRVATILLSESLLMRQEGVA
jgi:hypothetical protein